MEADDYKDPAKGGNPSIRKLIYVVGFILLVFLILNLTCSK